MNHSIRLGMANVDRQSYYNDALDLALHPGTFLFLTLAFRNDFSHGITKNSLLGIQTIENPSVSIIARGIDINEFEEPNDKFKWQRRQKRLVVKYENDPHWKYIL